MRRDRQRGGWRVQRRWVGGVISCGGEKGLRNLSGKVLNYSQLTSLKRSLRGCFGELRGDLKSQTKTKKKATSRICSLSTSLNKAEWVQVVCEELYTCNFFWLFLCVLDLHSHAVGFSGR